MCFYTFFSFSSLTQAKVIFEWLPSKGSIENNVISEKINKAGAKLEKEAEIDAEGNLIIDSGQFASIDEKMIKKIPYHHFSIETMVRIDQPIPLGAIIGHVQDNGSYEHGWYLGYDGSQFTFKASNGNKMQSVSHGKPFAPGQWASLITVYDGKEMKLYVDGVLSGSTLLKGKISDPNIKTPFVIGAYKDKDEFFPMSGRIKYLRIHDKALKHKDIVRSANLLRYKFSVRPSVRFVSPSKAVVSWEATKAGQGTIAYGTSKRFEHFPKSSSTGTNHEVTIDNLEPGRTYYYRLAATIEGKRVMSPTYEFSTTMNNSLPSTPDSAEMKTSEEMTNFVRSALAATKQKSGYCIIYGLEDGKLAYEVAKQSNFTVICLEEEEGLINKVRSALYKTGVYGTRVSITQVDSLSDTGVTSDFANLILSEKEASGGKMLGSLSEAKRMLRPNSTLFLKNKANEASEVGGFYAYIKPKYKDPKDWTHQYGTPANTSNINDSIGGATSVADLAVQWLGKPGGDFGIDRMPRMPAPLAVNGRLFHQGHDRMIALDAQNGHVLWNLEIPDLRRVNIPHDCSNWCADEKSVYVAIRDRAWIIDAETGKRRETLRLTSSARGSHDWGFIGFSDDMLIGSSVKSGAHFTEFWGGAKWYDAAGDKSSLAQVVSDNVFGYDKETGKGKWAYGKGAIINSTITLADGHVYFLENQSSGLSRQADGRVADNALWTEKLYLVCLNIKTGKVVWNKPFPRLKYTSNKKGFVQVGYGLHTHNSYYVILSQGGAGAYTYHSFDEKTGKLKWESKTKWSRNHHGGHMQHPVVLKDNIYNQPTGISLKTGKGLNYEFGPIGGCSAAVGSSNALFFRGTDGCITQWDLKTKNSTHWQRLRPSCWLSFIPSNGMLLAPEGGAGCSCGGWMDTSIGFIPVK